MDEAGDPVFYDRYKKLVLEKEGCSPILLLGLIRTRDPVHLRNAITSLQNEILNDKYFEGIPSIKKTLKSFHAKDDIPEVREKFYKLLMELDFKAEFIVARKIEEVFREKHNKNEDRFYYDLVTRLFENKLHKTNKNIIYFALRGNKKREKHLEDAILAATYAFEAKSGKKVSSEIEVFAQRTEIEPCLQIIDYMNWAVQRAFVRGEERYLSFVMEKVSFLWDIYDFEKHPGNFYDRKRPFSIKKTSPLPARAVTRCKA